MSKFEMWVKLRSFSINCALSIHKFHNMPLVIIMVPEFNENIRLLKEERDIVMHY